MLQKEDKFNDNDSELNEFDSSQTLINKNSDDTDNDVAIPIEDMPGSNSNPSKWNELSQDAMNRIASYLQYSDLAKLRQTSLC